MEDLKEKGNSLIEFSTEEKKVIMAQFFPPNTKVADMSYCMAVAKNLGLNPILNQIYFVPRRSKIDGQWVEKMQPLAGRDAFLSLAHRSKKFAGIKSYTAIKETPTLENGNWIMKNDLIATAEVFRKDSELPFVVEVSYTEYVQTSSYGVNSFWKDKPQSMLKKVAESQALRKAFNISGLYDESEVRDDWDIEVKAKQSTSEIDTTQMKIGRKASEDEADVGERQLSGADLESEMENIDTEVKY